MSKIVLRPEYQLPMVREISQHYQAGAKGIVLRCPTGGGKTRTASFIVEKYTTTDRQVLWIVDQEELLDQAAMTWAEYGIEHQLVCSDKTRRAIVAHEFLEFGRSFVKTGAKAVIASVQTLVRRLDGELWKPDCALAWLNPFQIIADECDLSLAATWRRVIGYWPDARLLGLTATLIRMDRQSFARSEGGLYDVVVHGPTEAWLIDNGFLSPYDAYKPDVHLVEGVADLTKLKGDDYDPQELEKELDAPRVYGDVVEHYRNYSHGKPAIAFCPTVRMAEKFAQAFRDGGYRAQSLDGMTEDGVRRNAVKALGRGDIDVLTGVGLLVKGVDIPYATTAIWLRKTKSLRIFMQGTGRVLRPHPDKEKAIILDCVGVIEEHGLPHWEREWTLSPPEKKARRQAANDNESGEEGAKACPKCRRYHDPDHKNKDGDKACPHCDHIYKKREVIEMEQVEAELKLIDQAEDERLRRQKRMLQGQAKSLDQLIAQGIGRVQAMKIVAAREKKDALLAAVLDNLEAAKKRSGLPTHQEFGVTLHDIRRMKPKDLKALLERTAQPLVVSNAA
jgi:superfamily II DNA or RNA helicase